MESWTDDFGTELRVHDGDRCVPPCAIHAPSDHPLVNARRLYRLDVGLMERVCEHGIGHPDPDDVELWLGAASGVHSCDGCCRKDGNEPVGRATETPQPA